MYEGQRIVLRRVRTLQSMTICLVAELKVDGFLIIRAASKSNSLSLPIRKLQAQVTLARNSVMKLLLRNRSGRRLAQHYAKARKRSFCLQPS